MAEATSQRIPDPGELAPVESEFWVGVEQIWAGQEAARPLRISAGQEYSGPGIPPPTYRIKMGIPDPFYRIVYLDAIWNCIWHFVPPHFYLEFYLDKDV